MLKQFDVVQILTTKRIRFVSGPPGHATKPHGNWSVVGFMGNEVVLAKDSTIVRAPVADVRKIANYDLTAIQDQIDNAGFKSRTKYNMPTHISHELKISIDEARDLLLTYNYRLNADSTEERNQITQRIKKLWECQKKRS